MFRLTQLIRGGRNPHSAEISVSASSSPQNVDAEEGGREETFRQLSYERYRFILQQINATNENVYRFLGIYQTLMTALVGGEVALFLGYRQWGLPASLARQGILALLTIETVIACFAILMIVVGILAWFDYRNEECDLADRLVGPGFRSRPIKGNFFRWYETYIVMFVFVSAVVVWGLSLVLLLPNMK
jgi:hypothetical protein